LIDDLTYKYCNDERSNHLWAVGDNAADVSGRGDFTESSYANGTNYQEYQYDNNGNMYSDANKLTGIDYNCLNLPRYGYKYGGTNIYFVYKASGEKIATKYSTGPVTMEYIGPFVYKNNILDYVITSEGRAVYINGSHSYYEYHIKDHLGNVRVAFKPYYTSALVLQKNDYYPFVLLMAERIDNAYKKNKYLYNGKEYHTEMDINWYDYGARMYDPQLGRWHVIDKLAEYYMNFSPYAYCANNPIKLIDIDGRYFDDENEKRAQRKEQRLIDKQDRLANRAIKMASKGRNTDDIEARQQELDKSLDDISNMRSDTKTEYRYASINSKEARENELEGPTTMSTGTNEKGDNVVTMFTESNMRSSIHESRHGGDIARGDLEFNSTGGYGVSHEISAYRAQYSWNGKLNYREYMSNESFRNIYRAGYSISSINKMLSHTIKNINAITPSIVNSIADGEYPFMKQLYPPRDKNSGNLIIPLDIWNSH
jgi:RHS repeat-associated protein